MIASILATVLLAVPISGGTKAQQERAQKAIDSVPACLRECGLGAQKPPKVSIYNAVNAEYHAGEPAGNLYIGAPLIDANAATARAYAVPFCSTEQEILPYLQNLDSWMLHEYAHQYDFDCTSGEGNGISIRGVEPFLRIRFHKMVKAIDDDPELDKIWETYKNVSGDPRYLSEKEMKLRCELSAKRDAIFKKHGLPMRHAGDTHARDANMGLKGGEYFAIAIQTLVYQPEVFCSSYNKEEIDWLRRNLGGCLKNMPALAPCYVTPTVPNLSFAPKPDASGTNVGRYAKTSATGGTVEVPTSTSASTGAGSAGILR